MDKSIEISFFDSQCMMFADSGLVKGNHITDLKAGMWGLYLWLLVNFSHYLLGKHDITFGEDFASHFTYRRFTIDKWVTVINFGAPELGNFWKFLFEWWKWSWECMSRHSTTPTFRLNKIAFASWTNGLYYKLGYQTTFFPLEILPRVCSTRMLSRPTFTSQTNFRRSL
jgi:hypothetical protein